MVDSEYCMIRRCMIDLWKKNSRQGILLVGKQWRGNGGNFSTVSSIKHVCSVAHNLKIQQGPHWFLALLFCFSIVAYFGWNYLRATRV